MTYKRKTRDCIVCGRRSRKGDLCELCSANKCSGRIIPIPEGTDDALIRLAGRIIQSCLSEYKAAYRKVLENPYRKALHADFERLDRAFRSDYHQALSLGHMDAMLDRVRHDTEREVNGCRMNRSRRRSG